MSISAVSQSLSVVSNAVNQPTLSFSGHLYALFQYRRLAVPTLVISTVVGAALGAFVMVSSPEVCDTLARRCFGRRIVINPFYKMTRGILSITAGVLALAGVNIAVSKLFHLPFSRRSSIGITVATFVLPLLLILGAAFISNLLARKKAQASIDRARANEQERSAQALARLKDESKAREHAIDRDHAIDREHAIDNEESRDRALEEATLSKDQNGVEEDD